MVTALFFVTVAMADEPAKRKPVTESKEFQNNISLAKQGDAQAQYKTGMLFLALNTSYESDLKQAAYWFEKSAIQGHADAQYYLSLLLGSGFGLPKDEKKSMYWLEKAVNQGHPASQTLFGLGVVKGEGVPKDVKRGMDLLQKVANQGHADAQIELGDLFIYGRWISKDLKKGIYWYEKAANQNEKRAQINLGELYLEGEYIPKDYKKAAFWLNKAANQNDIGSQYKLGELFLAGDGVAQDFKKAAFWYEKAAQQGVLPAQTRLGELYYAGKGVVQDFQKAAFWYKKAANDNYTDAQVELGKLYEAGKGVPQSDDDAFNWYSKAAENYNIEGRYNVGRMLIYNKSFATKYAKNFKNDSKEVMNHKTSYTAYVNFKYAAERGHSKSQYELALLSNYGIGTSKDYEAAAYWFEKAAQQGVVDAQIRLGQLYLVGHGVPKDFKKAIYWYGKDAKLRNPNIDKEIEGYFNFCNDINTVMLANEDNFQAFKGTLRAIEKSDAGKEFDKTIYNSNVGLGKYAASSCYITDDTLPKFSCRKKGISYQVVKQEASKLESEVLACLALFEIKSSSGGLKEQDFKFSSEVSAQIFVADLLIYPGYLKVSGECEKSESSNQSECFNKISFTSLY